METKAQVTSLYNVGNAVIICNTTSMPHLTISARKHSRKNCFNGFWVVFGFVFEESKKHILKCYVQDKYCESEKNILSNITFADLFRILFYMHRLC